MRLLLHYILLVLTITSHSHGCPESCVCNTEFVGDLLDPFVDCSIRGLESIPEGIPSNTTHLDLRGNRIMYLLDGAFGSLRDLVFLDLSGNGIREISGRAFTNLTSLEILRLYYNKINSFEAGILSGLSSLRRLEMYGAGIARLGSRAFRGLTSIEDIDLSHNRITEISSHTFLNLPALAKVSLNQNRISTIQLAAFMGLHNFTYLHLANNSLKYIKEGAIIDVPNLKTVFLFGNPLVCDCDAMWLYGFLRNHSLNTAVCVKPTALRGRNLSEMARAQICGGPAFYVHPMLTMYAQAGQTITLTCGAVGTPDPQIFWSFEKKPIIGGTHHEVTYSGDLVISDARYSDSGVYHCTASSQAGAIAASTEVIIGDPPQFNRSFSGNGGRLGEVGVAVGGTAIIQCPLEARPDPEYVWRFEGVDVDLADEKFLRIKDGTLVVVDVRESDFGRYLCLARNFIGTAIYETDLFEFKKPMIATTLPNWIAHSGTNITLYCDIRGYPVPLLSWYRNGTLIAHSGIIVQPTATEAPSTVATTVVSDVIRNDTINETDLSGVSGDGFSIPVSDPPKPTVASLNNMRNRFEIRQDMLVIIEALESDSGLYECRGVNSFGSANTSGYVLIGGFGKPVVSAAPNNQISRAGETAFLYCNVTGYPNPTIKWTFDDQTIDGDDDRRFLRSDNSLAITNVQPVDDGYYRCHAKNIAGYDSASVRLTVESYPKFLNLSTDTSAMGWQTVDLRCVLDRTVKPPSKLTWYFNGKRLPDKSFPRHQPVVNGHLMILEVEGSDAGLYACIAENNAGAISHSFALDVHVPVKIMRGPVNQQAVLGSAAVFTCNALGKPTPTIEWRINDMPVLEMPGQYETDDRLRLLTIVKVKRSDHGIVTCVASAGNQSMRAHAKLEVLVPPLVVQGVSDGVFLKKSTGIVTCAVDGNPEPDVKWQKDGKDLPVDPRYRVTPGVSSILAIDRLEVADSGKYTCIANSTIGSVSSSGIIEVQEAPVAAVPPRIMVTVRRGKTVHFPCNATGEPTPTIKWTPFPNSPRYIESEDGSLIILDVQPEDEGDFLCTAENVAGTTNITMAWLDVAEFYSVPHISVCPRPQTVRIGQAARFECFAAGNPLPTIYWLHNGVMIESGMNGFDVTPDGTLTIANVNQTHAGEMTCVAENTVGVHSFVASLTVIVPPAFTKEPMDTRQATGRDVLFQCSAEGTPIPTIRWTKLPSQELPYNEKRYLQLEDGSLVIRNVERSDEGHYVCEAVSPIGKIMASAELLVESESVTDDMQSMMNETQQHENMTVPEGQTVILHCMVASFPHATYYWSFNGSIVQGDTTKQFTTIRRSLVIAEVGYSADGEYICTASNGTVYIQNIVYLKTLVPPDIYYSPHSQALAWTFFEDGVDGAEFLCEASGYPIPTIYWTKDNHRLVGDRFTVNSRGHLIIKPLTFDDAGDYTCIAANSAGVARKTASLLIQDNRPRDYCYPTLVYHHVRYKNCRTAQKVENYRCEGHCFSQEYLGLVRPSTVQKSCCRVNKKSMRYVKATCSNGATTRVLSPLVRKCTCAVCHGAENVVLPVNEYR